MKRPRPREVMTHTHSEQLSQTHPRLVDLEALAPGMRSLTHFHRRDPSSSGNLGAGESLSPRSAGQGGHTPSGTAVSPALREGTQRKTGGTGMWQECGAAWGLMQNRSIWEPAGERRSSFPRTPVLLSPFRNGADRSLGWVHSAPWWPACANAGGNP